MGKNTTEEKEEKYGSKLGIDNKKDGLIPSFKLLYSHDSACDPSLSLAGIS